jgi:hypothetical protein
MADPYEWAIASANVAATPASRIVGVLTASFTIVDASKIACRHLDTPKYTSLTNLQNLVS